MIFSTLYSSSPSSVIIGGGLTCLRWNSESSLKADNRLMWNTLWIRMVFGRSNREAGDDFFSVMVKGPAFLLSIFFIGRLVWMLEVTSHTLSPTSNSWR